MTLQKSSGYALVHKHAKEAQGNEKSGDKQRHITGLYLSGSELQNVVGQHDKADTNNQDGISFQ